MRVVSWDVTVKEHRAAVRVWRGDVPCLAQGVGAGHGSLTAFSFSSCSW